MAATASVIPATSTVDARGGTTVGEHPRGGAFFA